MLKKFIVLVSLFITFLFAQLSQSQIISAIKSNPALLDTPKAKAELKKRGISKDEILSKLETKNIQSNNISSKDKKIKNSIYTMETNSTINNKAIVNDNNNSNSNSVFVNPLAYIPNSAFLKKLSKKQSFVKPKNLTRYGISFFKNRNNIDISSLPVPEYYILSPNDTVNIWIYGTRNDNLNLTIDNNGNINIPKYGPLHIAGLTFKEAKRYIKQKLKKVYENTEITVNITNYSTIQVNLVGDVMAPGVYNINSLSTIKNLLITAHGIKPTGSLRDVILKRDGKVIATVDFYKLLQNGDEGFNVLLRQNDTVFIPKANKIVSIYGDVNNPAKFELKKGERLDTLIRYAGGIKASASKYGFLIKRYQKHKTTKTIEVDLSNAKNFKLLDGDEVYVYKIGKAFKNSVYIYGNVVRPGEKELGKDRSLRDLLDKEIAKFTLKGVFLDDTMFNYALLKRKDADLNRQLISFNLSDVLKGKRDIKLQNDDEIYIFNKYNSNITPYVTIIGSPVIHPGKFRYFKNMKIKDLLTLAGTNPNFNPLGKVRVTTYHTKDYMPKTTIFVYNKNKEYKLYPFDEIEVFNYYKQHHTKTFHISGEVNLPGKYSLNKNMTLKEAIEIAGGFTPRAYKKYFEVIRYYISNDKREKRLINVSYNNINSFKLKDYDEISVHIIPNWGDRKTVTIKGEVNFPGTYVIEEGDRLADIIKRAGGFTENAFLAGAVFTRESIKELQRKRLKESIINLKQQALALSTRPNEVGQGNQKINFIEISNVIDKISKEAQNLEPIGRISIKLQKNLNDFAKSSSNIVLKDKDTLTIPSSIDTVLVVGEVMSPTAVVYESSDVNYYLKNSGGLTQKADKDNIYVIHANGSAQKIKTGWFSAEGSSIIKRGDTIVVPQKLLNITGMQMAKDISSILYKFALTAAAMHTVGAL